MARKKKPAVAATLNTRKLPLAELLPAGYNPRKITKHALDGLKASLEEFGYADPVIWNARTGLIVGGHQRVKALADLGVSEVEVVVVDLDHDRERALNITLNNPALQGTWDDDKLQVMLEELQEMQSDFSTEAFERVRLDELAASFDALDWDSDIPDPDELAKEANAAIDALESTDKPATAVVRVQCSAKDLQELRSYLKELLEDSPFEDAIVLER